MYVPVVACCSLERERERESRDQSIFNHYLGQSYVFVCICLFVLASSTTQKLLDRFLDGRMCYGSYFCIRIRGQIQALVFTFFTIVSVLRHFP